MKELLYSNAVDENRSDKVREVEARGDALRSFETVRVGGPRFDLMPGGRVQLRACNADIVVPDFGHGAEVRE